MSAVAGELDALRIAVSETEALAAVTAEVFDRQEWDDADPLHVERIASLLGLIARSASGALAAYHRLRRVVSDALPAPADEAGGQVAMSAEDAAIVRRIRSNSPDGRYNGGSDAELIELFKRNKRVLARSDDDVIAVMTRSR